MGAKSLNKSNWRCPIRKDFWFFCMSGWGNCYDNPPMEGFRGTLKTEQAFHWHYPSVVSTTVFIA